VVAELYFQQDEGNWTLQVLNWKGDMLVRAHHGMMLPRVGEEREPYVPEEEEDATQGVRIAPRSTPLTEVQIDSERRLFSIYSYLCAVATAAGLFIGCRVSDDGMKQTFKVFDHSVVTPDTGDEYLFLSDDFRKVLAFIDQYQQNHDQETQA